MKAYLGLGSNLGDRAENLREAVRRLAATPGVTIVAASPVYETDPVGPPQPVYLNAVVAVALAPAIGPRELYRLAKDIERAMGRTTGEKWGPRIVDIDILLVGEMVLNEPDFIVPHPSLEERAFVLAPLADIAPDFRHPVSGCTVTELLASVGTAGVRKTVASLV